MLASRGSTGVRVPSANARACSDEVPRAAARVGSDSADLDDHLDLDRGVERQHRDADRGAGVPAGVAEDLADQLGGAVGDPRLPGEVRGGGDEDDELDDPASPARGGTSARIAASALSAHCCAHSTACSAVTSPPTLPVAISSPDAHRQLAGGEDVVARCGRPGCTPRPAWRPPARVSPSSASRSSGGAHAFGRFR